MLIAMIVTEGEYLLDSAYYLSEFEHSLVISTDVSENVATVAADEPIGFYSLDLVWLDGLDTLEVVVDEATTLTDTDASFTLITAAEEHVWRPVPIPETAILSCSEDSEVA
jgi:hypothetical protein